MHVTLNFALDLLRLGLALWALVSLFNAFVGSAGKRWSVSAIILVIAYILVLLGTVVTIS